MPLRRSQLRQIVKLAMNEVGDLKETIIYHSVVTGLYDPVTDTQNKTDTAYGPFMAANVKLKDAEFDYFPAGLITQKWLIQFANIPVPTESDYLIWQGQKWEVRKSARVPGDVVWQVFVQLT